MAGAEAGGPEKTDPDAALLGGINAAVKSSQHLSAWDDPAADWVRGKITDVVTALTRAELGEAAREVTCGIQAESWAVVYRSGGSLRPHAHYDSAWSGVYYVEAGPPGSGDAGYLQLLDPNVELTAS